MNRFASSYNLDGFFKEEPDYSMNEWSGVNRDEAEELYRRAYDKQMQGEVDDAVSLYKQSLEAYPTAEAHTFLGWAYAMKNRFEDAILECQKAIALDQDFGNPYNDIGAYLIEMNKYDEALPWLTKALEAQRYDGYFFAHYNIGRVWEKRGDWFKAFEAYSQALDSKSDYTLAKKAMARLSGMMN